jgi:hypothetical protein
LAVCEEQLKVDPSTHTPLHTRTHIHTLTRSSFLPPIETHTHTHAHTHTRSHAQVFSGKPEAAAVSTGEAKGPIFAVGDKLQALWTDKKFYKAMVSKIVSTFPVKYSVTYVDTKLKSATVPEMGGVKPLEVVAPKAEGDPDRHHAGLLTVYTQLGVHGDSTVKLAVADAIAAAMEKGEVVKFKALPIICSGLRTLLAGTSAVRIYSSSAPPITTDIINSKHTHAPGNMMSTISVVLQHLVLVSAY